MTKYAKLVAIATVITITSLTFYNQRSAEAAALQESYLYLSRMEADIASGVEMILAVSTTTSMATDGTITIEFPDGDDGNWCRTPGTLTVGGVAVSAVNKASAVQIDQALTADTAFVATCTAGGVSTGDRLIIDSVGPMTAGQVYGVSIEANAAVLGTDDTAGDHITTITVTDGVNTDSSSIDVELIADDTVTITAEVAAAPTITCSISSTTVNLGTLYAGGSYTTAGHTISTTTSADAGGYYWTVYGTGDGSTDAGLYKSTATTYLLESTGSNTIDLSSAEGFGMTASAAAGATLGTGFAPSGATFGAIDIGYDGARMLTFQESAETGGDTSTITYGARAGASAESGTYTENVTFVCGGYY